MKILFVLLLCFSTVALAQKTIDIPENQADQNIHKSFQKQLNKYQFADLTKNTDSLVIRIWMGKQILELTRNKNTTGFLVFDAYSLNVRGSESYNITRKIDIAPRKAKQLLDHLILLQTETLPDSEKWGMDGVMYIFEISTPSTYRQYSYWSPYVFVNDNNEKKAVAIIDTIREQLNTDKLYDDFFQNLPSGYYMRGMIPFVKVDRLLGKDEPKSSAYLQVEKLIRKKLEVSEKTNSLQMPKMIINGRSLYLLKDLNLIEEKDINSIKVTTATELKQKQTYIDADERYGLIKIETKENVKELFKY